MKKIILALGLFASASSAFAYDFQIDGGYTYLDHDYDRIDSNNQVDLKGTYYFNTVETKNVPLQEAAFFGHSSNVYVRYAYNNLETKNSYIDDFYDPETDDNYSEYGSFETESHSTGLGIEYFLNSFYLSGEIGLDQYKSKYNYSAVSQTTDEVYSYSEKYDDDQTTYKAYLGYLPISNLLVAMGVEGYSGDDEDDAAFGIKAKYVTPIGQSGQFLNLEAAGTFNDITNIALGADYYFNPKFSIGTAYNYQDDGDDTADAFAIRTKYFFTENIGVGTAVGFGDDLTSYNLNATLRF